MKSAKIFLIGMYVHILFSIGLPIGMIFASRDSDGWNATMVALFVIYLIEVVAIQIIGWITVAFGVIASKKGQIEELKNSWKMLKFSSIPFFVVNFFYSFMVWTIIVAASRGILFFLIPIPIFITCQMIVQSGMLGILYLNNLKKTQKESPSGVHYVLQLLSVLDVVSTFLILKKYE